mmetsp:Transcript_97770/g.119760  ORF Transcript_97770/g.119760 Transcript_97770/m.119760 type:complete len:97 (+) Transcript_97770:18-308(+)
MFAAGNYNAKTKIYSNEFNDIKGKIYRCINAAKTLEYSERKRVLMKSKQQTKLLKDIINNCNDNEMKIRYKNEYKQILQDLNNEIQLNRLKTMNIG